VDSILKRLIPRHGSTNKSALERINHPSLRCLFDKVEAVTTITKISKQSSIVFPSGFSLKAVADTRFHTLHDSLSAFSKSFNHVQSAFEEHGTPAGLDKLPKIRINSHGDHVLINIMVDLFHPFNDLIKHMQTTAAASIHTVFPILIVLRDRLLSLRIDFARLPRSYTMDIEVANAADILLADALAEVSTFNDGSLGSVGFKVHPLHCASLLLHPLTRSKIEQRCLSVVLETLCYRSSCHKHPLPANRWKERKYEEFRKTRRSALNRLSAFVDLTDQWKKEARF
jgi:hypothetical protein